MDSKIDIDWGNVHETVLVWTFYEGWDEKDYFNSIEHSNKMIRSKSHKVHVFIDLQHARRTPKNIIKLARSGIDMRPSNLGQIILINDSAFWQNIHALFKSLYPMPLNFSFARNSDEAYRILHKLTAINFA